MSVASWIRRQFKNGVSTSDFLAGGISNSAGSFTLHDGTSFPDGSVGDFIVTMDEGLAAEEKILCASRTGAVFTVAVGGRGYNGTTASAHSANASCYHTIDQQDLDEANQVAVATLGAIQASGDLLVGSGSHALSRLAKGATNSFLQAGASTLSWVGFGSGRSQTLGTANADGTDTTPARSDHVHAGLGQPIALTGATQPTRYVGATTSGAPASGTFAVGDFVVDQTVGVIWVCTTAGSPGTWKQPTGQPLALTGATAPTRYAGGTTSGAPSTGTFATGDFVVDESGAFWICTSSGSPGTWVTPPLGNLGYTQITTPPATISSVPLVDVAGLSVTVTVGAGRRIKVSSFINDIAGTGLAGDQYGWFVVEGSTVLNGTGVLGGSGGYVEAILTPSAGSHTYKVQANHAAGTTAGVLGSSATTPTWIKVEDIGQ